MFGPVPKLLWQKTNPPNANNLIEMCSRSLLIEDGNRLVLIDTGMGNKQSEKFFSHYNRWGDENLDKSLRQKGFHRDDITDVFLDWNSDHPVSQFEIDRNSAIANRQNSRNPFIDNPFLAHYIWGGPVISDWWSLSLSPRITINDSSSETETNSSDCLLYTSPSPRD